MSAAYLFGLPPHLKARYGGVSPFIAAHPHLIVEIGQVHLEHGNHASAAECFSIAMNQTIDLLVQVNAAILTVDAFAHHGWKNAERLTEATDVLDRRAAEGNPYAIEALKKYFRYNPTPSRLQ